MAERNGPKPCIVVLAGVNGAGKRELAGALLRRAGMRHYDPDLAARVILDAKPSIGQSRANGIAWAQGKRFLERAIARRESFAFETTLGGGTIVVGTRLGTAHLRAPGGAWTREVVDGALVQPPPTAPNPPATQPTPPAAKGNPVPRPGKPR